MTSYPLCINCEHHHTQINSHLCYAPQNNIGRSVVTGEPMRISEYCEALRVGTNACGRKGHWFTPKINVPREV